MINLKITYVLELLKPTKRKQNILFNNISEVVENRRDIATRLKDGETKLTSAHFKGSNLPSIVINQNIREVKALYNNFKKSNPQKENIEFKPNQPICYNNQNYKIDGHIISIPLFYNGKCQRFALPIKQTDRLEKLIKHMENGCKLGKASLFYKNNLWYFAVTVDLEDKKRKYPNVMGIDIELRQLAVASIMNLEGEEINRQFYNGNEAGFKRKKYRSLRRKLGMAKKLKKIKSINNKEQRWIRDLNHKISRQLVNLAVQENVGIIVMENLKNIRETARSFNRADRNINSWAFYDLQQFIEYKANLAGIEVIYINPKYTSQRCSKCGKVEKSNRIGNLYSCACGNHIHADLNGSRNIAKNYIENICLDGNGLSA